MATMDIFKSDAFSLMSMLQAIDDVPYNPQFLGELNIFEDAPQRTRVVSVESRGNELALIQTSPIGAPPAQLDLTKRLMRMFETKRLAKQSTLYAEELQGIRAFGSETELQQVQAEIARRQARLKSDLELTWENHRLGALQGLLLDADDTVIYNFFTEFGVSQPAVVTFDFANLTNGSLRTLIEGSIVRPMVQASKGAITTTSQIYALVGNAFWDAMMANAEIRQSYLNYVAAAELRNKTLYVPFQYAGVTWINYRGTDDNSTVAIATDEAKFFPVNAPGIFKVAWGPGEFLPVVNQPGVPVLPMVLPDPSGREAYVTVEIYSYPLFICTRPQVLYRGALSS